MKPAIHIEGLSKLYRIGRRQSRDYRTLREAIVDAAAAPWRRLGELSRWGSDRPMRNANESLANTFWALQDVSFDVERGEVIGVIGRNGAGKSTLLRILSRITEPTRGRVELRGRVVSLLEIGTGFHFELTGRENIFLNGAILGMTRREMSRRFDEIVAFADIGDFLDTPVKRYSSGMHVRLAFAVACHLESEILIVDEVLAVGDQGFQKKCMGKLDEVGRSGRTVLFVSHNMAAVQNLCQKAAVLEQGRLTFLGSARTGIERYLDNNRTPGAGEVDLSAHPRRRAGCRRILRNLRLLDDQGRLSETFQCGHGIFFQLLVESDRADRNFHFGIIVEDGVGCRLFTVSTLLSNSGPAAVNGRQWVTCSIDQLPMAPGRYCASVWVSEFRERPLDVVDQAAWFDVIPADIYENCRPPNSEDGLFVMRSRWTVSDETKQR